MGPWKYVTDSRIVYPSTQTALAIGNRKWQISYILLYDWMLLWIWNNCYGISLIIFHDCHCSGGSKWSSIILASNNSNQLFQIWPWNTEWSRAKANRILPRERTRHSKHPLLTTQEKTLHMDITRWSTPKSDWFYSLQPKMEKLYIVSKNETGSWLWLRSWTPYCQIQT